MASKFSAGLSYIHSSWCPLVVDPAMVADQHLLGPSEQSQSGPRWCHWWLSLSFFHRQSLMEAWRAELSRQPLALTEGQACEALGLTPGPDGSVTEDDMRRAYRTLARR
jgi:hypothetical protein